MMKKYAPIFFCLLLIACKQTPDLSNEVARLKTDLKEKTAALDHTNLKLQELQQKTGQLVHIVFLKLEEGIGKADVDNLGKEILKMKEIPSVKNLTIGTFADLKDERALSDYDLVFQMTFNNEKAYQAYQKHPIHQNLKAMLGPFIASAPATYDYYTK